MINDLDLNQGHYTNVHSFFIRLFVQFEKKITEWDLDEESLAIYKRQSVHSFIHSFIQLITLNELANTHHNNN